MKFSRREYNRYMKSPAWKAKRAQVIFRDGKRCRRCSNGGKGLEAHHLTYERFGNENLNDLITLCPSCHEAAHAQSKLPMEAHYG